MSVEHYRMVVSWERDEGAEIQAIIDEVTAGFRKDVEEIMRGERKPHCFSLDTAGGIKICADCGTADTTLSRTKGCR